MALTALHRNRVAGTNDVDNDQFTITDDELSLINPDYEEQARYLVNIEVADAGGLILAQSFVVDVTDLNESPTDILFTVEEIFEEDIIGTLAGTFETVDEDADQTFTYTFDVPSDTFEIVDDSLFTKAEFDFLSDQTYSITVTSTDRGDSSFTKSFEVLVIDMAEPVVLGDKTNKLLVYPNPVQNQLHVQYDGVTKLEAFDLSGILVAESDKEKFLDTSNWNSGVYILRIWVGDESKDVKIIKK